MREIHAFCVGFTHKTKQRLTENHENQGNRQFERTARAVLMNGKLNQVNPNQRNAAALAVQKLAMVALVYITALRFAPEASAQYGARTYSPPLSGSSFYSLAFGGTNFVPLPYLPFDPLDVAVYPLTGMTNAFVYDDTEIAYTPSTPEPPPPPGEGGGGGSGFDPGPLWNYGTNDLWLDIWVTNSLAYLSLHGTSNGFWQLFSKPDLNPANNRTVWKPGEIIEDTDGTNHIFFTPLSTVNKPLRFFYAAGGQTVAKVVVGRYEHNPVRPCSPEDSGQVGKFEISISPSVAWDVTVAFRFAGSAVSPEDYSNNATDTVTIPANSTSPVEVSILPLYHTDELFEESVVLKLVGPTNGYLVDPCHSSATLWISGCLSNVVTTNAILAGPRGIDYHGASKSLLASVNYDTGEPYNFVRILTNGAGAYTIVTNWSGIHGIPLEVKLACVQTNNADFHIGDMFFGSTNGVVGWLSDDGTRSNRNWLTLSNASNLDWPRTAESDNLRGSFHFDTTGVWSNHLIVVTGDEIATDGTRGVWRIDSSTNATLITRILTSHLEGITTIPDDTNTWGPLAGTIVTGDETALGENRCGDYVPAVYSIATNGNITPYEIGIAPEYFQIIPTNRDLYCLDPGIGLVKIPQWIFSDQRGHLLIVDAGEYSGFAKLYIVHWNGSDLVARRISYRAGEETDSRLEHAIFAP